MNQHKRSPHSIFDFTYSLGKFLLFLIKLQVFWFLSVLPFSNFSIIYLKKNKFRKSYIQIFKQASIICLFQQIN